MMLTNFNSSALLRWPPRYVFASILCGIGGFTFGVDTGIIGSVVVMKSFTAEFGLLTPTIHGLVVASILIPAAVSSFFGGKVADHIGRERTIAIGSLIFGIGAAIEAAAVHIGMFVAGRIIEGIGEGLYLGTMVVYICEISPPTKRGPLTAAPQLLNTLGLVVGFFTCFGTGELNSSMGWRTPFILLSGYSIAFAVACHIWLPPSPRWLTLRGRHSEVAAAWDVLEVGSAEREKAQAELQTGVVPEIQPDAIELATLTAGNDGPEPQPAVVVAEAKMKKYDFFDVFAPDVRSRTILGVFLLAMQQMSGIDGVLYYAPLLFAQAGLSSQNATFLASGVSSLVIFTLTIPALIYSDRWGRRASTVLGGLGMAFFMFLIGGLYAGNAVHADSGAGRWLVIVSIYGFAAVFCISWSIGLKIYVAESQPQRTRASATNVAYGSNWVCNFLVALTTPVLLARSSFGAYFLFGGCLLLTALVSIVWMPETKGKSLDEIEEAFSKKVTVTSGLSRAVDRLMRRSRMSVSG